MKSADNTGFMTLNHNKRNVSLDMSTAEGLRLVKEIIRSSDVLIENYAPRVMERLGLDWDGVRELNPAIVMVRQPAYGLSEATLIVSSVAQFACARRISAMCMASGPKPRARSHAPSEQSGPA